MSGMICPLCGEGAIFTWCMDMSGEEWAVCSKCGGQTDKAEINAVNREDLPFLVPVTRKPVVPIIPEWNLVTRLDIYPGCVHPGKEGSDWLRDLIDGVFVHAGRIEVDSWSFPEEVA